MNSKRNYIVTVNGIPREVTLNHIEHNTVYFTVEDHDFAVSIEPKLETPAPGVYTSNVSNPIVIPPSSSSITQNENTNGCFLAPMAGILVKLQIELGQQVNHGQSVAIIEAMKMENSITSNQSGRVTEILATVGSEIKKGQPLFKITP